MEDDRFSKNDVIVWSHSNQETDLMSRTCLHFYHAEDIKRASN